MLLSYSFIFLAFVSLVPRVALAQEPAPQLLSEPINERTDNKNSNDTIGIHERIFIQLFVKRRKEHLDAVKSIRKMTTYEKQYKMVSILAENSLNVVETSRNIIGDIKFVAGDNTPLKNATVRDALSAILENSALFGDVVLQLPDITHRIIKTQKRWNATINWSLKFVNETRHLIDEPTIAMFDLVRQELNITPRDSTYTNPYWPNNNKKTTITNNNNNKRKRKKVSEDYKRNKGPRMINIEL